MDANAPKLAKVEKVLGRTGSRGGVIQVRVQVTHEVSPDLAGRSLIRNDHRHSLTGMTRDVMRKAWTPGLRGKPIVMQEKCKNITNPLISHNTHNAHITCIL